MAAALGIEGAGYLRGPGATPSMWVAGLVCLVVALLLLAGFLTPVAAGAAGITGLCAILSLLPSGSKMSGDSPMLSIFGLTICFALVVLGPGAFSVDARLFGRREIIIPRGSPGK